MARGESNQSVSRPVECSLSSSIESAGAGLYSAERRDEEWANGLSHAVGCGLSVAGTVVLLSHVFRDGSRAEIASCLVYCVSLISVYAASTLSHWVRSPRWRHWFRSWDQGLIYLLIAGTYTPIAVAYLDGKWHLITVLMWTLAAGGFISKVALRHQVESTTLWLYLAMGWLPILGLPHMLAVAPSELLYLMLAGGIAYTFGSILLMNDHRAPYLHTGWHVLVILGSALHFLVVWQYVVAAT
jgi:hemolysin III